MKKTIILLSFVCISMFLNAQTRVTLDLPNPCDLTGVETPNINDVTVFVVHPNPAYDVVSVNIETNESIKNADLKIYDNTGKCVLSESFFSANNKCIKQLNISNLAPGIYTISMTNNKINVNTKLIVN